MNKFQYLLVKGKSIIFFFIKNNYSCIGSKRLKSNCWVEDYDNLHEIMIYVEYIIKRHLMIYLFIFNVLLLFINKYLIS